MAVLLLRITLGNYTSQKPFSFSSSNPILTPKTSSLERHEPCLSTQGQCQGVAIGWGGSWTEGRSPRCPEGCDVPLSQRDPRGGGSKASALSSLPSVSLSAWAALIQQVATGQVAEQSYPSQSTHPSPPRWPGAGSPSLLRPGEGRAAGRTEDPGWGPGRAPQWGEPHRRQRRRRRRGRAAAQDRQQSAGQQGQPAEVTPRCRRRAAEAGGREEGTAARREELGRRRAALPQRRGAAPEPRLPWQRCRRGAQGPARRRRLQSGAPPGAPLSCSWWEASGPRAEQNGAQIQGVHRDRVFVLIILLRLRLWVGAGGTPAAQGASGSRAWAAGCQGRGDRHRQQTPRRLQCLWLY